MGLLDDGVKNEAGGTGQNSGVDPSKDIYENRPTTKKVIRVVTVMAYLTSVSFMAIALSGYYLFIWQPPNPRLISRPRALIQAQALYSAESLPIEITLPANKSNITTVLLDRINNFKNEFIQHHSALPVSSNKLSQIYEEKFNNTNAIVNSIITEPYRNKSDKASLDTRTDVRSDVDGKIDVSVKTKKHKASILFMGMTNASKIFTTTDVPYSTEKVIEDEKINSTDRRSFGNDHLLYNDKDSKIHDNLLGHELDDKYLNAITGSTVDSIVKSLVQSEESSNSREFHDEKVTEISLQNNTELMEKLELIYPPLPVYVDERETSESQMKEETFGDVLPTILSSQIHADEVELSNSDEVMFNKDSIPES